MTKTVDIQDAPPLLAELVTQALAGNEIVIMQGERRLARFVAEPVVRKQRILGAGPGKAWIADDFDAPLPDEFWLGEE